MLAFIDRLRPAIRMLAASNDMPLDRGLELDLFTLAPLVVLEVSLIGLLDRLRSRRFPLHTVADRAASSWASRWDSALRSSTTRALDDEADVIGQFLFFLTLAGIPRWWGDTTAMLLAVLRSLRVHLPSGGIVRRSGDVLVLDSTVCCSLALVRDRLCASPPRCWR